MTIYWLSIIGALILGWWMSNRATRSVDRELAATRQRLENLLDRDRELRKILTRKSLDYDCLLDAYAHRGRLIIDCEARIRALQGADNISRPGSLHAETLALGDRNLSGTVAQSEHRGGLR